MSIPLAEFCSPWLHYFSTILYHGAVVRLFATWSKALGRSANPQPQERHYSSKEQRESRHPYGPRAGPGCWLGPMERMNMKFLIGAIAVTGSVILMASPQHAYAQASAAFQTALGNAELGELSPNKRGEVEARMKQPGQTVPEILQTILLNSIKLKYPANRIVALDFGRGIAIVELPSKEMRTIEFDTRTLAIKA
jgi:hypothetical protein